MSDEEIRQLLTACEDAAMSSLDETEMEGYDHDFSDFFNKKMKRMLWSERYFGRKIHIGYALRKVAAVFLVIASFAVAGTVSAKVFDFRPWEYLPFYDWFSGGNADPEDIYEGSDVDSNDISRNNNASPDSSSATNKPINTIYPERVYVSGIVGEPIGDDEAGYIEINLANWFSEKCSITVADLPKGITALIGDNYVRLSGSPESAALRHIATITATDGRQTKVIQNVLFYIGSENDLIAYMNTEARYALSGDGRTDYFPLRVIGGEGERTYSLIGADDEGSMFGISDGQITVSDQTAPGEYYLSYMVTDAAGHTAENHVTLYVEQAVKVTGRIKNSNGSEVHGASIYFKLLQTRKQYLRSGFEGSVDSSSGYYTVYLPPEKSYRVRVSGADVVKRYDFEVGRNDVKKSFKIDLPDDIEIKNPEETNTPAPTDEYEEDPEEIYDPGPVKEEGIHEPEITEHSEDSE